MKILFSGLTTLDIYSQPDYDKNIEIGAHQGSYNIISMKKIKEILKSLPIYQVQIGSKLASSSLFLAQLGVQNTFIGDYAQDSYGKEFENLFKHQNLTTILSNNKKNTQIYLNLLSTNGKTTKLLNINSTENFKNFDNLEETIKEHDIITLEAFLVLNRSALLYKIAYLAKKHNKKIAFETSHHQICINYQYQILNFIENFVDILFIEDNEILNLFDNNIEDNLKTLSQYCEDVIFFSKEKLIIQNNHNNHIHQDIMQFNHNENIHNTKRKEAIISAYFYHLINNNDKDYEYLFQSINAILAKTNHNYGLNISENQIESLKKELESL